MIQEPEISRGGTPECTSDERMPQPDDIHMSSIDVSLPKSPGDQSSLKVTELPVEAQQDSLPTPKTIAIAIGNGTEQDLSLRAVEPVNVDVQHLSLNILIQPSFFTRLGSIFQASATNAKGQEIKSILNDVSASMPGGTLTAIIGASGSGKTSMLNFMSQRMGGSRLKISGDVLYNGSPRLSSIRSSYVMQQDVLLPTLTVRETLQYAADLRLPPPTTAAERKLIVEEVILELGLKECANTRIGNNEHKGCSGGEKRRTSLGVQLLANPSVLFLDEVTTGLDATSAFQLIKTLKQLAGSGRTVITTIHQPRSEIWGLFDNLVVLSGRCPIYSGPKEMCLPYFENLGYAMPPFVNPAEFLIDLAAIDTRSSELDAISTARVGALKDAWKTSVKSSSLSGKNLIPSAGLLEGEHSHCKSTFGRQLVVQMSRTIRTTRRDPMGILGSYIEAIALSVLTGWIFSNIDGSLSGIRTREGALYSASVFQGYLILLFETYRLTLDIGVFDRERAEGVVSVPSFLLSRRLARVFLEDVPIPLIFSLVFYFMAGFRHDADQFFIFFGVLLLSHYIALTLATLCVAISRDFARASLIANINFTLQSICSKIIKCSIVFL